MKGYMKNETSEEDATGDDGPHPNLKRGTMGKFKCERSIAKVI